jgi:hypothetical protein
MRYRRVRTALDWIWTFGNVTLHCCTPAHAQDIHGLCVAATVPDHETSSVRSPKYGGGCSNVLSMTHRSGRKVIGVWQSAFGQWGDSDAPALIVSSALIQSRSSCSGVIQ